MNDLDDARFAPWWERREKCEGCGKHKYRVIRRLDLPNAKLHLCEECHDALKVEPKV